MSGPFLTRRQFAGFGAAAAVLPSLMVGSAMAETGPFRAVYDRRFAGGHAFAQVASSRGWAVRAIAGDVTSLWYDELAPRWREAPAVIAGLTTPDALFVLERLAWDASMRVVARAAHDDRRLVGWWIGPRA